jgi:hypothetical protein
MRVRIVVKEGMRQGIVPIQMQDVRTVVAIKKAIVSIVFPIKAIGPIIFPMNIRKIMKE